MKLEEATILAHVAVQGAYRMLCFSAPQLAAQVRPGQFIHVQIPQMHDAALRRPFSVFKAGAGQLSILYKPVGRGTEKMLGLREGQKISLLGPLGNGFPPASPGCIPVLVAGGYGMAALYLVAAREQHAEKRRAFFGGKTAADILCVPDFEALGWTIQAATEDGSRGVTGLATDPLDAWLASKPSEAPVEFFVCGPHGLLRAVAERALRLNCRAWLSLDRKMVCGVGACLTCVQKVRLEEGKEGWKRVCKDGPVFDAREVVWD